MDKNVIRTQIKAQRSAMSEEEVLGKSFDISQKIIGLHNTINWTKPYLFYAATQNEVDISSAFHYLNYKATSFFPKTEGEDMSFYEVEYIEDLVKGRFGIYEPSSLSPKFMDTVGICFVPGIAFDKSGNRIGFGKGYYDRFLKDKPQITKIGICYDFQLLKKVQIPSDEFDIKMDMIVTEKEVIRL